MSRNSPTSPWRLIAMRMLRTVIPSQKHATTLALGRWALSLSSRRSKLCSPALLQIFPEEACQTYANVSSDSNDMTRRVSCFRCNRDFQDIQMMRGEQADLCYWIQVNCGCREDLTRVGDADTLLGSHVFECFHTAFTIVAWKTAESLGMTDINHSGR